MARSHGGHRDGQRHGQAAKCAAARRRRRARPSHEEPGRHHSVDRAPNHASKHDEGRFRGAVLGPPWSICSLSRSPHRQQLARGTPRRARALGADPFWCAGRGADFGEWALTLPQSGRGAQYWPCAARAGHQRLQVWSALGAGRQGCRTLGARRRRRTATLAYDLAGVWRSGRDRAQAPGVSVDRSFSRSLPRLSLEG